MSKKKKIILILVILFVIGLIIGFISAKKDNKNTNNNNENKVKTNYEDEIKEYGYTLEKRDNDNFRQTFKELKKELKKDNIDYENYAKLLTKLYIIDLYTIDNKENTYDIGGTEYIIDEAKENYETKIKDTLYKYIEDNSKNNRQQELPTVKEVNIEEITKDVYKYNEQNYDSYIVKTSVEYEKDLGYDKKIIVTIIKKDKKLYIVKSTNENTSKNNDKRK